MGDTETFQKKSKLRRIYETLNSVPAVFIDGCLYFFISIQTAVSLSLNSEEAYKYVNPFVLYWLKNSVAWGLAGCGAIKMFRSTSYSDHQDAKAAKDLLKPGPVP